MNCSCVEGSAKTPLYTVLLNESNWSADDLQGMAFMLSYCHQIVNSPISLPAPVMAAHELAKRGKANFKQLM